jgi:peptide-methionine (S)-S-oxide reductase
MQKTIVVAGGCFWGMQDLFRKQPGVLSTEVGYAGGKNENPTYEFHPGHAESIQITYDDTITSYTAILDYFFRIHNPTTVNQQGNDKGSSYRSAIFYADETEKSLAEAMIDMVNESGKWEDPVVTTLEPLTRFWSAEEYHQDYLEKHPGGYTCHFLRFDEPFVA